ncbi:MAG: hypothetical protein ACI9WU_000764 [Myxococcota bacterium]|jgi:hypothetical protein
MKLSFAFGLRALLLVVVGVGMFLPSSLDACSAIWFGQTEITGDDTPDCLRIDGVDFADDQGARADLQVTNSCASPVTIDCSWPACGDPTEVPVGASDLYRFQGSGEISWIVDAEFGAISVTDDGQWSDCADTGLGCQQ